jgi:MAP/microtubule affinity-regulating kinase
MALAERVIDWSQYTKGKLCGKGASSAVYQYVHIPTGKHVAVKRMGKAVRDPHTQLMFIRELSILLTLQHPTILPLVGFSLPDKPGGPFHIVTEFMPRGSLSEIESQEGELYDDTQKSIIAFGVAAGMKYVHSMHVCHRDLKAENIFLDENLEPKIADFGMSKFIDPGLQNSGTMGTPFYMAPELFDIRSQPSYPLDVFAYAVVLLSMLTSGRLVMGNSNPSNIQLYMREVCRGKRLSIPESAPGPLRELIDICWANMPEDRLTFEQIVDDLASKDGLFPGTDKDRYNRYKRKILDWAPPQLPPPELPRHPRTPFNFS